MSLDLFIPFLIATAILLATPGPTILLVVSYALAQGRGVALAVVGGVILGDLLAMSATLLGLGVIMTASAGMFTVMKWAGAAYLAWMGWWMIRSAGRATADLAEVGRKIKGRRLPRHRACHFAEPEIHRLFRGVCAAIHRSGGAVHPAIHRDDRHFCRPWRGECARLRASGGNAAQQGCKAGPDGMASARQRRGADRACRLHNNIAAGMKPMVQAHPIRPAR